MPVLSSRSCSIVFNRTTFTQRMDKENYRYYNVDKGQSQAQFLPSFVLLAKEGNAVGARGLQRDGLQSAVDVLPHVRSRRLYGRVQFRERKGRRYVKEYPSQ